MYNPPSGDIIRNEQFDDDSPISGLPDEQKASLRESYPRFTPFIRALFIALTALNIIWDMMLVVTVLYFHNLVQKMAGAMIAVCTWYFAYKFWFPSEVLPPSPGQGVFKYSEAYRR